MEIAIFHSRFPHRCKSSLCSLLADTDLTSQIIGLMIFGVQLQNTPAGVWNVTPLVGSALSVFGQQIVASERT